MDLTKYGFRIEARAPSGEVDPKLKRFREQGLKAEVVKREDPAEDHILVTLPFPIGANKSTTRADRLSLYPLHNLNFSSGKSGVR